MRIRIVGYILLLCCFWLSGYADNAAQPWKQWVQQLRQEALQQGIRPEVFDEVFATIHQPSPQVIRLDRTQPEKRITFAQYRASRADNYRIQIGRREYQKNSQLLHEVGSYYGVNPCFIVSLWGLETSYGKFMGKFPVIQSLATLAYDTRRAAFFRKQLLYALQIVNEGHVDLKDFKGEWAGGTGQPQFLPSNWHDYAVDYNQDGRKDIWTTKADVFASIANFLKQQGWQTETPWAIEVNVPIGAQAYENTKEIKTIAEWKLLGLTTDNGRPWPVDTQLTAHLVHPTDGPSFLTFQNFDVLMKWNRSTYYAGTVGYMAEQICGRPLNG